MTTLREAAQQALEALEESLYATTDKSQFLAFETITALRAALAEPIGCVCGEPSVPDVVHRKDGPCYMAEPMFNPAPGYCKHCKQYTIEEPLPAEPVEPVAWMTVRLNVPIQTTARKDVADEWLKWGEVQPLYTSPPQRKPLTEEEIERLLSKHERAYDMVKFARAVEAAHGIK